MFIRPMPYCIQNIIPLPPLRLQKGRIDLVRISKVLFIVLFLFFVQRKAEAQIPTVTTLTSSPTSTCFNQPVTFTATVDQSAATGNVNFWRDTILLGTAGLNNSGVASITLSDLPAGTHPIIAIYEGVTPFDGSISDTLFYTVNSAPVIISQPSNHSAFTGCSPAFSVTVDGTGPFTYQWKKNGANIANANSSTFTLNNIRSSDAGNYSVVVTNSCGSVTSGNAVLTISSRPSATINYGANQWCSSVSTPQMVTRTGAAGGIYQASPDGLDIDPVTGTIIPSNSIPGTYIVNYIIGAESGCPAIATRWVTILTTPTVLINSDFCGNGGSVRLTANIFSSDQFTYVWSTGATTSSILVDRAGPYSLTATTSQGCSATYITNVAQELVYNGNFSSGNVGFSSAYGNNQAPYTGGSTGLWPETLYAIGTNANTHHSNFFGTDHTTGNGNFMIVNGAGQDTTTVWRQSFAVQPNTTYYFSAWAMSLNRVSPYAQLKFTINDSLFGTTAVLAPGANSTAGPFNWTRFYGTWNSGTNTNITISIVDLQTAAGGNDFGLDDISFGTLPPVPFAAAPSGSACEGQPLVLNSNVTGGFAPYTYSWIGPNDFTSTAKDPVIPVATMAHAGTYTLIVTDAYNCPVNASTVVTINQAAVVNAGPNQAICAGGTITLAGTRSGAATSSAWSAPTGTFSNTSSLTPTYTPSISSGSVTLRLTSNDPPGICPAAFSTMIVTVANASANAGSPRTVCAGRTVNLSASIGGSATSATWSAPSGTFSSVNSLNAIYTPSITNGTVMLTLTTNDPPGPCGPAISTVVITVRPTSSVTQTIQICQAQLPYVWNGQNLTAAGIYNATLVNSNACDSLVTLNLVVNPNVTSTQNITICQNALPYSWNNQSLTAAGTYTAVLQNSNGCDSTVTLNLTVNPNVTSTQNITICQNTLPFSWNNQSLSSTGTYTAVLQNINGCDSTVTLNLTVNPNVSSTQNITICQNVLPYSWNNQSLTVAGTYIAVLQNSNGCDSTVTLHLTVNPNVTSTQNITICQNALPYSWNTQSLTSAGTYTAVLQNINGCDSTVTFNLTVNPNVSSTQNITICQNALPYNWNNQSLTAAGTYTAILQNINGCDSTVTLNLTVNSNVSSTQNITICQNALPYSWNNQSLTSAGTYSAVLQNINGCDSTVTLNLIVNPNVSSIQNITICQNALPYNWNNQSLNAAGDYTVTLISAAGCDSIATLHLIVAPQPKIITSPVSSCTTANLMDASVTAGSDTGLVLSYWMDVATTNAVSDPTSVLAGTYYIKGINSFECYSVEPVTVTIEPAPLFVVTDPASVCEPATVDLTADYITAGSDQRLTFTYWMDEAATIPLTNPHAVGVPGTYYIKAAAVGGCDFVKSVEVSVVAIRGEKSVRYPTVTVSPNEPVQLTAREPGLVNNYTWYPPVGLNSYNRKDPTFRYDQNTEYTVRIEAGNGCPIVDTIMVVMRPGTQTCVSDIFVPKAWSPNNDRHNDNLYPLAVCIKELKYFRVFNRWGQLVFETNIPGYGWDGIFHGQPQVMDTYTWTLEAIGEDGKYYKKAGNSVLIR